MIRGVVMLAALAMTVGSAHADIPKAAPIEAPMPVIAPPPPPKPAPPLPPTPKVRAAPSASPGSWVTSDDYPVAALRMGLEGKVGIRLFVDTTGKVSHCQITSSSNFQILDDAACELISRRGIFVPAKDAKGKAVVDVWTSRFVWKIPYTDPHPLIEGTGIETLTINNLGIVTDCAIKIKEPDEKTSEDQCPNTDSIPQLVALEMRGYGNAPLVQVDMEHSLVLTEAAKDRLVIDKPGYETRSLLVFHFVVDPTGKMAQCAAERQRGSEKLIFDNYCYRSTEQYFVPTTNASGTSVSTSGWVVQRILRKLAP